MAENLSARDCVNTKACLKRWYLFDDGSSKKMSHAAETPPPRSLNFLDLANELRNQIYELVLLHKRPINPTDASFQRNSIRQMLIRMDQQDQRHTTGLLRANKAIYREASSLFYGGNCFDFSYAKPQQVVSFLERIGSSNAAHIRHLVIDFPAFSRLKLGCAMLAEDSVRILETIQSHCTNLRSLKTNGSSTGLMELHLDRLNKRKLVAEALELVDAHFRVIPSLQQITLGDGPSNAFRPVIRAYKWTISTTDHVEMDDYSDDSELAAYDALNESGNDIEDGREDDSEDDSE